MKARGALRAGAIFCHFIIFASAVIVMGLVSSFIDRSPFRGYRVVYLEVISVFTVFIYLFAIFFPMSRSYRGYMAPVSWIFTYLWITAFVFSSQVWSGAACANEQPSTASCSKKKTVEAFTFIAFFNTELDDHIYLERDRARGGGPSAKRFGRHLLPAADACEFRFSQVLIKLLQCVTSTPGDLSNVRLKRIPYHDYDHDPLWNDCGTKQHNYAFCDQRAGEFWSLTRSCGRHWRGCDVGMHTRIGWLGLHVVAAQEEPTGSEQHS
ncbi:membrane-associating domain-containing protein [Purpureocillium lilacinum]|uniref:Membrane-associating domain-containing protein n=1 Tax=Purpureocillium lilacinum TaxID=33203 RepID=A0A179GPK8_PURLI|nr:membrane-associating domain-containing protein [Purpureocillium lilacinum]